MRSKRLTLASVAVAAAASGLVVPAVSGSAAGAAPAAPYHVTLNISAKTAVAKEDTIKLSGTVTPKPPEGSKVVLQVKYEGQKAWKRLTATTVKPNGNYKFLEKPATRLDRVYRVVKATDAKATSDKSRERALTVTKWEWLTSMVPSATEGVATAALMPINGDDYSHTLYGPQSIPTGFREFTLGRDCLTLEGTLGLSDRTETGGKAALIVTQDGAVSYNRTFNLGESDTKSFDVTDVYRLRIDYGQIADTPATEPSFGAARVLCD